MSTRQAVEKFRCGYATVGVTEVKVVTAALPDGPYAGILLKAPGTSDDVSNTVAVYVGLQGVKASYNSLGGFPIAPGESIVIPLVDVDSLYAISSQSSQVLAWLMI